MRDLIVVGAGPGGSTLAALAARRGARVLLIDRARFPRDKVCGEFVSAEGCAVLRRLGVLDGLLAAGARWIGRGRLCSRGGRRVDFDLPRVGGGRRALGVSRALLDSALIDAAAAAGAQVRSGVQVVAPVIENGRATGVRLRSVGSRREESVPAGRVVAADGRRSRLARQLHGVPGDPQRSTPGAWFGLKTHLPGDSAPARVELHLFDGGYAGLVPVESGRRNLCLMTTVRALRACGGSPDRLLAERLASITGDRPLGPWHAVGPLRFGVRRPSAAGVLFVGDAAGTIEPFSGEGMSNAMLGAELAVEFALADAPLAGYDAAWRRTFAPVTRRVGWQGWLFARPRLAGAALQVLAGPGRGLLPRLVAASRTGTGS